MHCATLHTHMAQILLLPIWMLIMQVILMTKFAAMALFFGLVVNNHALQHLQQSLTTLLHHLPIGSRMGSSRSC